MKNNTWTWVALAALGFTALLFLLIRTFPGALDQQDAQMRLVYGVGLLALVGSSAVLGFRRNAGLALKQALSWTAIALALVIIYGYREEFQGLMVRTQGELMPTRAQEISRGVVSLGGDGSGHFLADAKVNGTHVRFLVDTGASHVALTAFDAQRLGFDPDTLDYRIPYQTANGIAYSAPIMIDEISIGSIRVENVRGAVSQEGLGQSLLGMSFLGELSALEIAGDRLILRE
ncbi:MAG: TIGR02281 family clan AA aspartic protease [Alphaproteobacteria bacterium]|jgi:aspartyl protease family protein|nr:TIGR02281 family clan AA aspartic protease [Rhodobiaceae bacterium]MBO6541783.1 TIGR02281 family clan AA aspartic protease [Alphaproteobacteria bacterium]MBO6628731.1 TIGR02281 family clan AA aspartic protease [Alphaproteobacteria bacterium]MDF1625977.1 TIGR02281 family clan AA aspartic protease [Parvibaculaceae bacterium]